MPSTDSAELKRRLRAAGFEIYRTRSGRVVLAERIRDNLIMDSGVAVALGDNEEPPTVIVVVRAQATHFPGVSHEAVLSQAWALASPFQSRGYQAGEPVTLPLSDPANPERTLDTSFEIPLHRQLRLQEVRPGTQQSGAVQPTAAAGSSEEARSRDLEEALFEELRAVLGMPRSSSDD